MLRFARVVFLATVLLVPAVARPSEPEDREAIASASRRFSAALVAGRIDEVAGLYTADAVLLPPGSVVRGLDAIRAYFTPRQGRVQLAHAMTAESLSLYDGVAVETGTWSSTWREGDGAPQMASERYLLVWRRVDVGSWKIAWDVWHRPAPAPPREPGPAEVRPSAPLRPELAALTPFAGRTWKGLVNVEKRQYDVSRWEVVLEGRAVRILHSVADGAYGGETLVRWDPDAKAIVYDYVTTAGFSTRGTIRSGADGRLECHERLIGPAGGIREVNATLESVGGGKMRKTTSMLRGESWEERPPVVYEEAPTARVVLP